jgi:DNA-binding transcriptional MerR regulator
MRAMSRIAKRSRVLTYCIFSLRYVKLMRSVTQDRTRGSLGNPMSQPRTRKTTTGGGTPGGSLLTLTQVAKRTGISMPTLQKYKKKFSDRIPSQGKGRTQRYPEEALPVFRQLLEESASRRGRPRKAAGAAAKPTRSRAQRKTRSTRKKASPRTKAKPAAAAAGESQELLSLTDISKRTKISYPTLMRYVRAHLDEIPHLGEGRKRRFPPEAVKAFQKLYSGPRGGRKAKAAKPAKSVKPTKAPKTAKPPRGRKPGRPAGRVAKRGAARGGQARGPSGGADVMRVLQKLESRLSSLEKELKRPIKVEIKRG